MDLKNITVSVDKETHRHAGRRRRLLNEVFADFDARGVGLRMADNLPRSALYDRDALR